MGLVTWRLVGRLWSPIGILYALYALLLNLMGGVDVTDRVLERLSSIESEAIPGRARISSTARQSFSTSRSSLPPELEAAALGQVEGERGLRALSKSGADLLNANINGVTALQLASNKGHTDCVRFLGILVHLASGHFVNLEEVGGPCQCC